MLISCQKNKTQNKTCSLSLALELRHISHLLPLSLTSCHLLSQEFFFPISLPSELSLYFLNEKVEGFEDLKGKYVLWIQYIWTTHMQKEHHHPGVMIIGHGHSRGHWPWQALLLQGMWTLITESTSLTVHSVSPGPATLTLPGSLLEMQNLRPHPWPHWAF